MYIASPLCIAACPETPLGGQRQKTAHTGVTLEKPHTGLILENLVQYQQYSSIQYNIVEVWYVFNPYVYAHLINEICVPLILFPQARYNARQNGIHASLEWQNGRTPSNKWIGLCKFGSSWWRHQMETFSGLLDLRTGNSPVTGEFPQQRQVTRSFDVFFHLRLNKRLSKQARRWWFAMALR